MKMSEPVLLAPADVANPVIQALAVAYRASRAGSTGKAARAFSIPYEKLVHERVSVSVPEERRAYSILLRLEEVGVLRLSRKPLARDVIKSVFIEPDSEARFFAALNEAPPRLERHEIVASLAEHIDVLGEHHFAAGWRSAIQDAMDDITNGRSPDGLPNDAGLYDEILRATAVVVKNQQPISLRRLGSEKLRDSKLLKRRRDSIERFMAQFLTPDMATLEAWHVADDPPAIQLHGPLGVELNDTMAEVGHLSPYTITDEALAGATRVYSSASCCISIENYATFREMASSRSGDLLIHTSYPSRSVVALLRALPAKMPLYHWGDTDPWGYDILRVLREKTGRKIEALRMSYRPGPGPQLTKRESTMLRRLLEEPLLTDVKTELLAMSQVGNKGLFEQESLPMIANAGLSAD